MTFLGEEEERKAKAAVFVKSEPFSGADRLVIKGIDFNESDWSYGEMFSKFYRQTGFQASNLGEAIEIVNKMLELKARGEECKIFLGYTSNMISCGIREVIRYLVQHKMASKEMFVGEGLGFKALFHPFILSSVHTFILSSYFLG